MSTPKPRPRAQLHDLKSRWGTYRITEGTEEEPRVLERRNGLGTFEVWVHVQGRGSKSWFECRSGGDN